MEVLVPGNKCRPFLKVFLVMIPHPQRVRKQDDRLFPSNPLGTEAKGVPGTNDIFRVEVGMRANPCLFWNIYPTASRGPEGNGDTP